MKRTLLILFLGVSVVHGQATKIREGSQTTGALPTAQGGAPSGGSTNNILGKTTGTDYDYGWKTISAILDSIGSTQGQVLYRGASGWSVLATGTDGNQLTTHGAGADPTWDSPGGGGGGIASTTNLLVGDGAGNASAAGNATFSGQLVATGVITPSQITSDQNNYNPTGLSGATTIRVSSDSTTRTITGLQGGVDGRILFLQNANNGASAFEIVFSQEDTNSTAANRFANGFILSPFSTVMLQYDGTAQRWRNLRSDFGTRSANKQYQLEFGANYNGYVAFDIFNDTVGTATRTDLVLESGNEISFITNFSAANTANIYGIVPAGSLAIQGAQDLVLVAGFNTGASHISFSNDAGGTERVRIAAGLMVGTTTDPGAGVINVATGLRIGGAAPSTNLIQANGTNYVAKTRSGNSYDYLDGTGNDSIPSQAPINAQNGSYTFVLGDAGKTIVHTSASAGHTYTIPANGSVAYPTGTMITIINATGSASITLAITTDTLQRGDGTTGTGSRTIAADSVVTIIKTGSTTWYITGKFS